MISFPIQWEMPHKSLLLGFTLYIDLFSPDFAERFSLSYLVVNGFSFVSPQLHDGLDVFVNFYFLIMLIQLLLLLQ